MRRKALWILGALSLVGVPVFAGTGEDIGKAGATAELEERRENEISRGGVFSISQYAIYGGGGEVSSADDFRIIGTLGQPEAGTLSGGGFELVGGFWAGIDARTVDVFEDGFETGDVSRWSSSFGTLKDD